MRKDCKQCGVSYDDGGTGKDYCLSCWAGEIENLPTYNKREQRRYEIASKLFIKHTFDNGNDHITHDIAAREFIEAADIFLAEIEKTEVKE